MVKNIPFVFILISLSIVTLYTSCNSSKTEVVSELSEGLPGEICIVANEEILDDVKTVFQHSYEVVDSILLVAEKADQKKYESYFGFWFARHQAYDGNEKKTETILIVETNLSAGKWSADLDKLKETESIRLSNGSKLLIYKNVWAKPQTVAVIKTKDIETLGLILESDGKIISDKLYTNTISAGLNGTTAGNAYTDSVAKIIGNNYGFTFSFPPQFRLEQSNHELIWLWQETSTFYRHIFINIFSDSTPIANLEAAVNNRDYFSNRYIKNTEGTSIKVSRSTLFPLKWETNQKMGKYTVSILRGWYTEDGTYRRGPFVRYFYHDQQSKRYIAFDGFVYAPEMARLPFYRGFDVIANTLNFQP